MRSRSLIGIVLPIAILVITFLLINLFAPTVLHAIISYGDGDEARRFPSYNDCAASMCGNSTIRYPFGKCGPASTRCLDDQTIQITFFMSPLHFRVIGNITESSYDTRTLHIVQDSSSLYPGQYYPDFSGIFEPSEGYMKGTILKCTEQNQQFNKLLTWLDWGETDRYCYFYNSSVSYDVIIVISNSNSCTSYDVIIPRDKNYNISVDKNLKQLNQIGFQITWTIPQYCPSCEATGGRCYSSDDYDHYCVCHHGVYYRNCSEG